MSKGHIIITLIKTNNKFNAFIKSLFQLKENYLKLRPIHLRLLRIGINIIQMNVDN